MIQITALIKSKKLKLALIVLAAIIALLFIFKAGEALGEHKARFSYRWGENYHRIFGGPRGGLFKDFNGRDFLNSHGLFGTILKIDGTTVMVKSNGNTEQAVLVATTTAIRRGRDAITPADLKPDMRIIIIGAPNNQGQIEAKFIRVFDAPTSATTSLPVQ